VRNVDDDDNDGDDDNNNNNNKIWQLPAAYITPLVLSTVGIIPNTLHRILELFNPRPVLYSLTQRAAMLNTCRIVGKFLAEK